MPAFKHSLAYFTFNQFLKNHLNIGVSSFNLNRLNSLYILGLYFNVSFININKIVPMLKKKIFFFFLMFTKIKSDLLIINRNLILLKYFKKRILFLKINYFFGQWWGGFLKNFKNYYVKNLKNKEYFFFSFPVFIFFISNNIFNISDSNAVAASGEFSNLGLPSIFFIDTNIPKKRIDSGILANNKTIANNIFFLFLSIESYKNALMFRKKKFFYRLIKFFKFNNFLSIINLFYFFLFFNKKKKKIKVSIFWKNF